MSGLYSINLFPKGEPKPASKLGPHQLYISTIEGWPKDEIAAANENPIRLIYPYVRLLLVRAEQRISRAIETISLDLNTWGRSNQDRYLEDQDRKLSEISRIREALDESLLSLERFLILHNANDCPPLSDIFYTLKELIRQATWLETTLKDRLHRSAAMLSLEESRRSIEMADGVKKLTQIAFIFVPLSFGASVFGANVREFGSGTVPIWSFILTVLLISIATGFLWFSMRVGFFLGLPRRTYLLALYGLRSPYHALVLWAYVVLHPSEADKHLGWLRLVSILLEHATSDTVDLIHYGPGYPDEPRSERFWSNRLYQVYLFTRRRGWEDDLFYRRWLKLLLEMINPKKATREVDNQSREA